MEKGTQETGELIFLRYAFPVIGYCGKTQVNAEELLKFEKMLKFGGCPLRKRLEEIFPDASKHLRVWTPEAIRGYWLGKHNNIVRNNPLCKVYLVEVEGILLPQNEEVCRIEFGEVKKIQAKSYLNLDRGDKVSVHGFQVAEKLSQEDIEKYFRE